MSQFFTSLEKAVGEVYLLSADFTDLLAAGDYLIGCVVTVTVYSGYDLSPSNMLHGNPIVGAATIGQVIQQGVPGTIYDWVFLAATAGGKELELKTKIAIAPSGNGPYGITLLESCLYPYDFMEEFIPTVSVPGGGLNKGYIEYFTVSLVPEGGALHGLLYYTFPTEEIQVSMVAGGGVLTLVNIPPYSYTEEMQVSMVADGGTLISAALYYTFLPEEIQVSAAAGGGVLTFVNTPPYSYNEEMQVSVAAEGGTFHATIIVSSPAEEFQVAVVSNGGTLQT